MEKVKLNERVVVVGTGKSSFMPKGKEASVHPLLAKTLTKTGKATLKK